MILKKTHKVLGFILSLSIIFLLNCSNLPKEKEKENNNIRQYLLFGIVSFYSSSPFEKFALSSIELSKYAGQWYEVERIPNGFQGNLRNVKATYTARSDGNITVFNEGTNPDGSSNQITGVAIPFSPPRAILKVSFFFPVFFSDYYVVGLDSDYKHAMVGSPTPDILWILSRTPTLSQDIIDQYKANARTMGYNVDAMKSFRN